MIARPRLDAIFAAGLFLTVVGGCGELRGPRPGEGRIHVVRILSGRDHPHFDPTEVRLHPGERVRFVLSGPHPETVAFDTATIAPAGVVFLRRAGLLRGPLLTAPGQQYEVSFQGAPPGTYSFFSAPRAAAGVRGAVVVSIPARARDGVDR